MTLTLNMSEAVTVMGGAPTVALNDGGTATYASGSGASALTFKYTVAAGQNPATLAATAVNLNGATIADGAGDPANFSLSGLNQSGPQIDTVAPEPRCRYTALIRSAKFLAGLPARSRLVVAPLRLTAVAASVVVFCPAATVYLKVNALVPEPLA